MNLTEEDAALFHTLYAGLLVYVNRALNVVPEMKTVRDFREATNEARGKIRDALWENRELVDRYVAENPDRLTPEELALVAGWKHAVIDQFYVFRDLKRYTVFLTSGTSPRAYGVLGIVDDIVDLLHQPLPMFVRTALLPFRGKIVWDGLVEGYHIYFGPGIRSSLEDAYREVKATTGIIETLPPPAPKPRPAKPAGLPSEELAALLEGIEREVAKLKAGDVQEQEQAFALLKGAVGLALAIVRDTEELPVQKRRVRRLQKLAGELWDTLEGKRWE